MERRHTIICRQEVTEVPASVVPSKKKNCLSRNYELVITQSCAFNIVKSCQSLFFATMDLNDISVHKHPNIHYVHGYILSMNSSGFALLFVLWPYNE